MKKKNLICGRKTPSPAPFWICWLSWGREIIRFTWDFAPLFLSSLVYSGEIQSYADPDGAGMHWGIQSSAADKKKKDIFHVLSCCLSQLLFPLAGFCLLRKEGERRVERGRRSLQNPNICGGALLLKISPCSQTNCWGTGQSLLQEIISVLSAPLCLGVINTDFFFSLLIVTTCELQMEGKNQFGFFPRPPPAAWLRFFSASLCIFMEHFWELTALTAPPGVWKIFVSQQFEFYWLL